MQHQQLETLQQNSCRQVEQQHQQQQQQLEQQHQFKQQQQQLEQQQQQLEQHQLQQHHHGQPLQQQHEHQQRSFSSITGESDQGLRTNCELGSTHSLHQPENINRGSPDGSKIQSSGSQDNWQNGMTQISLVFTQVATSYKCSSLFYCKKEVPLNTRGGRFRISTSCAVIIK